MVATPVVEVLIVSDLCLDSTESYKNLDLGPSSARLKHKASLSAACGSWNCVLVKSGKFRQTSSAPTY